MSDDQPLPAYSFLEKAAAEARLQRKRYWAKGGAADRRYPIDEAQAERAWPLAEPVVERKPGKRRGMRID